MLYSRRICTEDRIFDPVQAIQIDSNVNGSDEYASNVYENNK